MKKNILYALALSLSIIAPHSINAACCRSSTKKQNNVERIQSNNSITYKCTDKHSGLTLEAIRHYEQRYSGSHYTWSLLPCRRTRTILTEESALKLFEALHDGFNRTQASCY